MQADNVKHYGVIYTTISFTFQVESSHFQKHLYYFTHFYNLNA